MKVGHTSVPFPGIKWLMFLYRLKGCRVLFPDKRYTRVALVSADDYKKSPAIADRYIHRELPEEIQRVLSDDKRGTFLYNGTLGTLVKKGAPHGIIYVGELPGGCL